MDIVTAVMVKNYRYMETKYGADHRYVHRMRVVVHSAGLAQDLVQASTKLRYWSKKIHDDTTTNNNSNSGVLLRATIFDKLQELSSSVGDLLRTRQQEQLNHGLILSGIADLKSGQSDIAQAVRDLQTQVAQLTTMVQNASLRTAVPSTPSPRRSPRRRQTPQQQPSPIPPPPPPPPPSPPPPPPPPEPRHIPLVRAGLGSNGGGRGVRSSERRMMNILLALYQHDDFRNLHTNVELRSLANIVNLRLGGDRRNFKKVEAALDLVDCLWSADTRTKAINKSFDDEAKATQAFSEVDQRVKRTCHVHDNPGDKHKPNSQRSTAIIGVGNLILKKDREPFFTAIRSRMPKWGTRIPPVAVGQQTLWDIVTAKEDAIKARVRTIGRRR
eukprot:Sro3_g002090.2  (385) ;mRNA; r:47952-49106